MRRPSPSLSPCFFPSLPPPLFLLPRGRIPGGGSGSAACASSFLWGDSNGGVAPRCVLIGDLFNARRGAAADVFVVDWINSWTVSYFYRNEFWPQILRNLKCAILEVLMNTNIQYNVLWVSGWSFEQSRTHYSQATLNPPWRKSHREDYSIQVWDSILLPIWVLYFIGRNFLDNLLGVWRDLMADDPCRILSSMLLSFDPALNVFLSLIILCAYIYIHMYDRWIVFSISRPLIWSWINFLKVICLCSVIRSESDMLYVFKMCRRRMLRIFTINELEVSIILSKARSKRVHIVRTNVDSLKRFIVTWTLEGRRAKGQSSIKWSELK